MVARELERNSVATFSADEWRGGEGREGKGRGEMGGKGEGRKGEGRHMGQQSIGKVRDEKKMWG